MNTKKISYFELFIWISAIEGAITLLYLLGIPTDHKNAFLLGFSRSRLILVLGILIFESILIWLGYNFWRNTKLSKVISAKAIKLTNNRKFLWLLLVFLILLIVGGSLLLFQWKFGATDQQIAAYLQRISPVVLLGIVICVQGIIFLRLRFFKSHHERWFFILILLGGYILFLWLLLLEFILAHHFLPDFYLAEYFGDLFEAWMPYILFQSAIYIQLPYLLRHRLNININYGWFGLLIVIGLAYFYYNATLIHAQEINTNLMRSDQNVYMEFTRKVSETNFQYCGVRNQTPGYPFFQALFCNSDLNDQELFMCGKRVNIFLSIALLALLYLVFRRFLPSYPTFILLLIVTISLFVFKAGYMTVELYFYFASFISFLLMCIMIVQPSFILGFATGIALALTFYLKASVLPGIALFIFVYLAKFGWKLYKQEGPDPNFKSNLLSLLIVVICFLSVLFPYIRQSKEIYGQYFYNVNSNFYIWYDSFDEAKQGEHDFAFKSGWPDLPEDQIPGPRKYFRDHSFSQILARLSLGLSKQFSYALNQFSVFNYLLIYLILMVSLLIVNPKVANKKIKEYFYPIFFVVSYCLGYIFLFSWYYLIAGGPRFIAGLYIPILFSIFIVLYALLDDNSINQRLFQIKQTTILRSFNSIIVALLITDAFIVFTKTLPGGYFGS